MSKTPRTDEYAGISEDFRGVEVVPADISRELEKRLAEAQAELADKDKQLAGARADADHWKSECNALQRMVHEARADVKDRDNALAAIMAVLPDSAKPCDAPDLIKHFKSQMLAYGSEYIRIEKQLKEARAVIERKDKKEGFKCLSHRQDRGK